MLLLCANISHQGGISLNKALSLRRCSPTKTLSPKHSFKTLPSRRCTLIKANVLQQRVRIISQFCAAAATVLPDHDRNCSQRSNDDQAVSPDGMQRRTNFFSQKYTSMLLYIFCRCPMNVNYPNGSRSALIRDVDRSVAENTLFSFFLFYVAHILLQPQHC